MFKWYDSVWLTNGEVAWEIPADRDIASRYVKRIYLPYDGWSIIIGGLGRNWKQGKFGEMRRIKHE
ncbi:MAG: hypothetical protein PHI12_08475 [Dehalococcoidales bacterium]|nr:hypothetical protein [Dehalococcoidales bacterium]